MFTDLDTSTVDPERAAIHVTEFLVWWHQAGRHFYGWGAREEDAGLCHLANDAVDAVGGWRPARRILQASEQPPSINASDPHAPDPGKLSTRV